MANLFGYAGAKWYYFGSFILTTVVAWVLRDYGQSVLKRNPVFGAECAAVAIGGITSDDTRDSCLGKEAVLRVSFGNLLFFALHTLLLIGVRDKRSPRGQLHSALWPIKIPLHAGLLTAAFFVPVGSIEGYGEFARIAAAFFLIFQLLEVLDLIYNMNSFLLDGEATTFRVLLIIGSFSFYVVSFIGIGFSYKLYAPRASCGINIFWITWTLIMAIFTTLHSVTKLEWRNPRAGLLTAGAVFAYCTFLLVSALGSEPRTDSCVSANSEPGTWFTVLSFVIAIGALAKTTLSLGSGKVFEMSGDDQDDDLPYKPELFHLVLSLASCYMAMMLTGWSLEGTPEKLVVDSGWYSAWVKILSQWVCFFLYAWTVAAPAIFKDRDFSFA